MYTEATVEKDNAKMPGDSPLGRPTAYPDTYDPSLLHPIPRAESRAALRLAAETPFRGEDVWNAWDLTWLLPHGQPVAASAVIRIPATSRNIVESKSMKLYLNSLSMVAFDDHEAVAQRVAADLSQAADGDVAVAIDTAATATPAIVPYAGRDLDAMTVDCKVYERDAALLSNVGNEVADETLYTHAFRSLCPVTGQPDLGSVRIRYRGRHIDDAGLLRYLVSYRQHQDFHEACVERMFVDILERCQPERLSVSARFQRRGGIDINPFRSSDDEPAGNSRLWRQ